MFKKRYFYICVMYKIDDGYAYTDMTLITKKRIPDLKEFMSHVRKKFKTDNVLIMSCIESSTNTIA